MIYVTGDMHGDLKKLKAACRKLKKQDTLLIAGDFGFIWDGSKEEQKRLAAIGKQRFNVCFIDGANENHELLDGYAPEAFCGGQASRISGNLWYLRRGEVYTFEDRTVFAFGGARSDDIESKRACGTWYARELPDEAEMQNGLDNLQKAGDQVDFVLTHEPGASLLATIEAGNVECDNLQIYLDQVAKKIRYGMWIFGRLHRDRRYTYKCTCVFSEVLCLNAPPPKRGPAKQ